MLLLFYNINLESNIVILLGIIIILLINNLIKRSEHFTNSISTNAFIKSNINIDRLQENQNAKFDIILDMMKMINKSKVSDNIEIQMQQKYKNIIVNSSCVKHYDNENDSISGSDTHNQNNTLEDKIAPVSAVLSQIPN